MDHDPAVPPEALIGVIELNASLKLPPLIREICHGYQFGCICPPCLKREKLADEGGAVIEPHQPWEPRQAA